MSWVRCGTGGGTSTKLFIGRFVGNRTIDVSEYTNPLISADNFIIDLYTLSSTSGNSRSSSDTDNDRTSTTSITKALSADKSTLTVGGMQPGCGTDFVWEHATITYNVYLTLSTKRLIGSFSGNQASINVSEYTQAWSTDDNFVVEPASTYCHSWNGKPASDTDNTRSSSVTCAKSLSVDKSILSISGAVTSQGNEHANGSAQITYNVYYVNTNGGKMPYSNIPMSLTYHSGSHPTDTNEHVYNASRNLSNKYVYILSADVDSTGDLGSFSISFTNCDVETLSDTSTYKSYKATPRDSTGGTAAFYVKYNDSHSDHARGCNFWEHRIG